jgi:hypothetical protein
MEPILAAARKLPQHDMTIMRVFGYRTVPDRKILAVKRIHSKLTGTS